MIQVFASSFSKNLNFILDQIVFLNCYGLSTLGGSWSIPGMICVYGEHLCVFTEIIPQKILYEQ